MPRYLAEIAPVAIRGALGTFSQVRIQFTRQGLPYHVAQGQLYMLDQLPYGIAHMACVTEEVDDREPASTVQRLRNMTDG